MCRQEPNNFCCESLDCSDTCKWIVFGGSFLIHLILAILSGIAWHYSTCPTVQTGLMWIAISPVFHLLFFAEQRVNCGERVFCPTVPKIVLMFFTCFFWFMSVFMTWKAYSINEDEQSVFSKNMVKTDAIVLSVVGAMILLCYVVIELYRIFTCRYLQTSCEQTCGGPGVSTYYAGDALSRQHLPNYQGPIYV